MGLSGTGKSTLAAALAEATDFVWLRSDVIRKHDDATKPAPTAAERYGAAARAAVYVTLAREADAALAAGRGVIADATFIRRADRARLAEVAARHGCRCLFVETRADEATVRSRLAARTSADVSDARWDTYVAQRNVYEPCAADEAVMVVATDGPPAAVSAAALRRLWAWHRADG
jgi:predicted kinase